MIPLAEVLRRHWPAYQRQFSPQILPSHRRAVQCILTCRTRALGGEVYRCGDCQQEHFVYHSCNHRACPQCGHAEATAWIEEQKLKLLPVPYYLITFTVPEGLRRWIRSHPRLGYDLLLAASSQALQDLAQNPKRLGATLGLLGVLHTWTRTLEYHPHVHYLVPGGGLSPDQRQWIASRPHFLLPVKALSDRCRTLFREALQKQMPEALADLPPKVWQQRWVVHSAAVGSGQNALRYLSRYVFKTATGNRPLQLLPDGRLRWPFRHSGTGTWRHIDLQPFEFLRRFLQHVLPGGFHRVRRFGWLHPGGRAKLKRVRALLHIPPRLSVAEQAAWQPPAHSQPSSPAPVPQPDTPSAAAALRCPHCGHPLVLGSQWPSGPNGRALIPHPALGVPRTTGPP